jgi:hypothetical protein
MAKERTFAMNLTPVGARSSVLMDGDDISGLLRGIVVRSSVDDATTVELQPAKGHRAEIIAMVPEAAISIAPDDVSYRVVDACVRLAPWLRHRSVCARSVGGEVCDCGLNEVLKELKQ